MALQRLVLEVPGGRLLCSIESRPLDRQPLWRDCSLMALPSNLERRAYYCMRLGRAISEQGLRVHFALSIPNIVQGQPLRTLPKGS
jgi:hypothetical protein